MITQTEADAKDQLLMDVINSRQTLKDLFRSYHIQQQRRAQQTRGLFDPVFQEINKLKDTEPTNEEIKEFLKRLVLAKS